MSDPNIIPPGIALTNALIEACTPLVDQQKTEMVIEAMCAAMMALLIAGTDKQTARLVLHRYAERILEFAEKL